MTVIPGFFPEAVELSLGVSGDWGWGWLFYTSRTRPHGACLDGESGGQLDTEPYKNSTQRAVFSLARLAADVGRQPGEREHGRVDVAVALADHLIHHPHEVDGVLESDHGVMRGQLTTCFTA